MTHIDRRKALILLSVVAATAVLSGIVLNAYSADNGEESNGSAAWANDRMMAGAYGFPNGPLRGHGCFRFVEVSAEFEENVTSIAKSDQDVQNLLNDGYNITGVRPIIKARVEANGDVITKATSAVVMLEKDTTSHATVLVDLEEGKVTEIVILTRTVIEKP